MSAAASGLNESCLLAPPLFRPTLGELQDHQDVRAMSVPAAPGGERADVLLPVRAGYPVEGFPSITVPAVCVYACLPPPQYGNNNLYLFLTLTSKKYKH
ncbi:hypothetical protein EYF80_023978 [Liparis tanakae]|uniref:Uncharacterized protein n=1 Tax=Liparis tanakae TaxID=230148 RepID=A0A4Z2HJ40_9TELE|nr:hypothetical protein EYF80_023978 [Liparis tanakae]